MKNYYFLLLTFVFATPVLAQKAMKADTRKLLAQHNIQVVDSASFFSTVLPRTNKPKVVYIYTNLCGGTESMFALTIPKLRKTFADEVDVILISSAPARNANSLIRVLQENNYTGHTTYIVDPAKFKEYWQDDRKKGHHFRNAICEPCQKDIIGVPYCIVYDANGNYLNSGYLTDNQIVESINGSK